MRKRSRWVKKSLKILIWFFLGLILLLVIIAGLIQLPAIQTRIIHEATSFVSNKTDTKVEISKISIAFPKSVVIDGIFLEDQRQDTLLYIGDLDVGISLVDLLFRKVTVSHLHVKYLTTHIYNTREDSVFNYHFLISAFNDTTQKTTIDSSTNSPWLFNLAELQLQHLRLQYKDEYGGMNVATTLQHLNLDINELDFPNAKYDINKLFVSDLSTHIQLSESNYPINNQPSKSKNLLPTINAHYLQLSNSDISFKNTITSENLKVEIHDFSLKSSEVNLQKSLIELDNLSLAESKVHFYTPNNDSISESNSAPESSSQQNQWKVKLNNIHLTDNQLSFTKGDTVHKTNSFNPNNLKFNHFTLLGKDIGYSANNTQLSILKFQVQEQNGFAITQFTTDFSMDQHNININNLEIKTSHSSLAGKLAFKYSTLQSLKDSLGFLITDINLEKAKIGNADLLYFSPNIASQPYLEKKSNMAYLSGQIKGPINDLEGKNLKISLGDGTVLTTDFAIKGLPEIEKTFFKFPNLKLKSNNSDIQMLAGKNLPESLNLPEFIDLNLTFQGGLHDFKSTLMMESSFGSAEITAQLDAQENFNGKLKLTQFNLGTLLKDTALLGPITLSFETSGQGLNLATVQAQITGEAKSIYFNHYVYQNIMVSGKANNQQLEGTISLSDENIAFDFDGLLNFKTGHERVKFRFNLKGADLKKLQLTPDDIQIGLVASADLTGNSLQTFNGNASINQLVVMDNGEQINLDSIIVTTTNSPTNSEFDIQSPLIGLKYRGTTSPMEIPSILNGWASQYFYLSDTSLPYANHKKARFDVEIQLHDHPLITQILLPKLTEFEPGNFSGSFNSDSMGLQLNASMPHLIYDNVHVEDLAFTINSNDQTIEYKLSSNEITNPQLNLDNFALEGKIAENKIHATLSSYSKNELKNLLISVQLNKINDNFRLSFDHQQFYLMNEAWDISDDNYLLFGPQGFLIHNVNISKSNSLIGINSVNNTYNDDLSITLKNFKLYNIFGIIETDSNFIRGTVDGQVMLKRVHESYGIIADAEVNNLEVMEIPVGNISLKAESKDNTRFDLKLKLYGAENELNITGYLLPNDVNNSLNLQAEIPSFSMKTIQALSMGHIQEASGTMSGKFTLQGNTNHPNISGELTFNNTLITPSALNNQFTLKNETIQVRNDGIHFNQFTLLDMNQHQATINGSVKTTNLNEFIFALDVNTNDFLLINTTAKDNTNLFGKMIIDSDINIKGPMSSPVINAKMKLKNGSNITIAVPESQLTTNKGQGIVEFAYHSKLNPILEKSKSSQTEFSKVTGIELASIIEVDKLAKFRLLMDPTSNDSLVVQGEAAMSFSMDRSGKMSLTGAYQLTDGSYVVSLESLIKKKFAIEKGSTITWNGDPMDAGISINAIYSVRASPNNLIGEQTTGVTEADKNASMQRYPFLVVLKIRGEVLTPEISFEIKLPPEEKGILGGAVEAKLLQLNEDPSELNKQVFSLLILGRFVQENPLEFGVADGTSNMVRSTVSSLLSSELNKWGSKLIPGVELNFDVNSYNEYESNQTVGRTQVDVGIKKQMFDERLTVQIGGVVDVEGAKAKENSVSNITSDVSVEYELTKDGRYRLIGFSHNQYEGAIEGQVVETGVGIIYQRDFDEWKDFFKTLTRQK